MDAIDNFSEIAKKCISASSSNVQSIFFTSVIRISENSSELRRIPILSRKHNLYDSHRVEFFRIRRCCIAPSGATMRHSIESVSASIVVLTRTVDDGVPTGAAARLAFGSMYSRLFI